MPIHLLDRREIKQDARDLIHSARVSPLRFTLLYLFISLVLDLADYALTAVSNHSIGYAFISFSFVSILIALLSQVLGAGYHCYCLGVHRREEMPYESLFDGFTFAGKVIALLLLESLYIFFWSLLFFIPGIIAAYRYSFAMWNLCETPDLSAAEALRRSKTQTRGYKWQLFVLQFSFIGWAVLVGLVTSLCDFLVFRLLPGESLATALLGLSLNAVLSGAVEVYLVPYYMLSCCGFYRRATAAFDDGGRTQTRGGYDPEF